MSLFLHCFSPLWPKTPAISPPWLMICSNLHITNFFFFFYLHFSLFSFFIFLKNTLSFKKNAATDSFLQQGNQGMIRGSPSTLKVLQEKSQTEPFTPEAFSSFKNIKATVGVAAGKLQSWRSKRKLVSCYGGGCSGGGCRGGGRRVGGVSTIRYCPKLYVYSFRS